MDSAVEERAVVCVVDVAAGEGVEEVALSEGVGGGAAV